MQWRVKNLPRSTQSRLGKVHSHVKPGTHHRGTIAAGWRAGPSGLLCGFMLLAIALTLLHPRSLTAAQPNQPTNAPAQLQAACDKGDGQACYDLGTRYEEGDGVAKNADRAVTLYERSCEIGDAGNCWYLGTVYEDGGFGLVAPNVNRAAALYRKGCERGDGNACFSLGLLYKAGKGVPRNPAAAAAFIRKGCVDLASGVCEDSGGLAVHMMGLGATARPQASTPSSPTAPAQAAQTAAARSVPVLTWDDDRTGYQCPNGVQRLVVRCIGLDAGDGCQVQETGLPGYGARINFTANFRGALAEQLASCQPSKVTLDAEGRMIFPR